MTLSTLRSNSGNHSGGCTWHIFLLPAAAAAYEKGKAIPTTRTKVRVNAKVSLWKSSRLGCFVPYGRFAIRSHRFDGWWRWFYYVADMICTSFWDSFLLLLSRWHDCWCLHTPRRCRIDYFPIYCTAWKTLLLYSCAWEREWLRVEVTWFRWIIVWCSTIQA